MNAIATRIRRDARRHAALVARWQLRAEAALITAIAFGVVAQAAAGALTRLPG